MDSLALSLQSVHCFNFSYLEPGLVPSNQLSLVKGQSRLLATGAFSSALLSPVRKETSCCCLLTFQERCREAGWREGHLQHQELTSLCVLLTQGKGSLLTARGLSRTLPSPLCTLRIPYKHFSDGNAMETLMRAAVCHGLCTFTWCLQVPAFFSWCLPYTQCALNTSLLWAQCSETMPGPFATLSVLSSALGSS